MRTFIVEWSVGKYGTLHTTPVLIVDGYSTPLDIPKILAIRYGLLGPESVTVLSAIPAPIR
jgi:hypothetical protein